MDEPRRIGRYEVVRVLGRGGMGAVYLARDPLIDRQVAIKVLAPGFDEAARARFAREARAAGRLDHENIATIFDVGEHDGEPFLAMEFVAGDTLGALIRSRGRLPLSEWLRLVEDACAGLAFAHRAGIVHLDVKPENLMRREDGRVKVLDFGIARVLASEQTETRHLLGTLRYMAPEQLRGANVDLRTDVFAVGCVLYEVIAGTPAFSGELAEIVSRIEGRPPVPLTSLVPQLPAALVRLTNRAMSHDPADRYDNLDTLRRELAMVRAGLADRTDDSRVSTSAMPIAESVDRRSAAAAAAAVVPARGGRRAWWAIPPVVAMVAGAAILWSERNTLPPPATTASATDANREVALPPAPKPPSSTTQPAIAPEDANRTSSPEAPPTEPAARTTPGASPRQPTPRASDSKKGPVTPNPAVSPSPTSPFPETTSPVGLPFGGVSSSDPPAPPPPPRAPAPLEGAARPETGTTTPPAPLAGAKPVDTTPRTPSPENAIRSALAAYAAAYDQRDVNAIRRVFPAIPREQANALTQRFSEAVSYRLVLGSPEIVVTGTTASAVCAVTHEFVPKIGTPSRNSVQSRFQLRLADGQWVITRIDSGGAR